MFEVSTRTIERDILALQEAGVPIRGVSGRRGGYVIDASRTLPPLNFTPAEALAVAVALDGDRGPFAAAGRTARHKVISAMSSEELDVTRSLAGRIRRFRRPSATDDPRVPLVIQRAIAERLVVALDYSDSQGNSSTRDVEPVGLVSLDDDWYLVAWCRLRDGARSFRLDRIQAADLTGDVAASRDPASFIQAIPWAIEEPALFD